MRRIVFGLVLVVAAAGCTFESEPATSVAAPFTVQVVPTPQEFDRVSAGDVEALIPPGWRAVPADPVGASRQGFVASPHPMAWGDLERPAMGLSATWIDATRVGVPSDYYYLAATGPVLSRLVGSESCRTVDQDVYVDNAPEFIGGGRPSAGDYVARGEGVCTARHASTRWAYFVAAPGLGPAREVGIPASGLYVVVALAPEGPKASALVQDLLRHTRFGDATTGDIIRAVRRVAVD